MPSEQQLCFHSSLRDCFWENRHTHNTHSPLAVSFQRNPRLKQNLIKHLLRSLILHGV